MPKILKRKSKSASTGKFSFASIPAIGTSIKWGVQVYTVVATEPYTRKDGKASGLITWETACRDCGEKFNPTKTGLSGTFHQQRCVAHRTFIINPAARALAP
jgi:hypothetical protein